MSESPRPLAPIATLKLVPQPDWPAERQRAFLHVLLRSGDVIAAAATVGASASTIARLRRALARNSAFARAWRKAAEEGKVDAMAKRVLRRHGVTAEQLARLDAVCHGFDKVRFTCGLLHRAGVPA